MNCAPERSIWVCGTRRCNFGCSYCYQGAHTHVPDGLQSYMSRETADLMVGWSHKWAMGDLVVCWYGGEPLMTWDRLMRDLVPEWIEQRAALELPAARQTITTNGSLLRKEIQEWMDRYGVGMMLSLDGPKRFHDKSRPLTGQTKSTWDMIRPLELLAWRPRLEIAWQLDPKNFDPASGEEQITAEVVQEMREMGFKNLCFNINWMDEWSEVARWNLQWLFKTVTVWMIERQRAVDAVEAQKQELVQRTQMLYQQEGQVVPLKEGQELSFDTLVEAGVIGKDTAKLFWEKQQEAERKGIGGKWWGQLQRALTSDQKMVQPCGTGLNMVGVSPEGWLYPSQEMVYTVVEPGRAPGTAEYYRLGDLRNTPVLDVAQLAKLSAIRTEQMRPPAPFKCETCVAKSASIGGCHCRYVGDRNNGVDVSNRYDVTPGYCQSTVAAHTGMLMGASVARYVRPEGWKPFGGSMQDRSGGGQGRPSRGNGHAHQPVQVSAVDRMSQDIARIAKRMEELDLVVLQTEER
jgi:sulfatase maturation enzyme AslB (radical SAM superfamily)